MDGADKNIPIQCNLAVEFAIIRLKESLTLAFTLVTYDI